MAKHDVFSPKAVANRIKAKGLQRLRWFCQMCQKQCRDENGFKCHCASESHQRQMAIFAENPERYMEQFSQEFEDAFLSVLARRYGTKQVSANQVYQEIVADRQHLHMNATSWDTLSEFVKHLGRSGKCRVEDSERGWMVSWIDTSPEALARQAAIQKKELQEMDDEQREQKLLQEQIERARQTQKHSGATGGSDMTRSEATALARDSTDAPIKLAWKPAAKGALAGALQPGKISLKPRAALAKAGNPFRTGKLALSARQDGQAAGKRDGTRASALPALPEGKPQSAIDEIMQRDLLRERTRRDRSRSPSSARRERRRSRSPP
ncbi:hypothetical protein LPJ61_003267 [Coemansia biformis]|uniref:DNA/RNA-binding protein Kin17 WH-like domain-containing protein n=1 Tax=Coemansia biformis TaxID=1286918 RepID=A0A9W7YE63_9FUNG|nr:hypothetical protein LPJ61_003267 [Coemansia biformis]